MSYSYMIPRVSKGVNKIELLTRRRRAGSSCCSDIIYVAVAQIFMKYFKIEVYNEYYKNSESLIN